MITLNFQRTSWKSGNVLNGRDQLNCLPHLHLLFSIKQLLQTIFFKETLVIVIFFQLYPLLLNFLRELEISLKPRKSTNLAVMLLKFALMVNLKLQQQMICSHVFLTTKKMQLTFQLFRKQRIKSFGFSFQRRFGLK